MKVVHTTTVDLSLRFLVFPQLKAVVKSGGEAVGISAPGPWVAELESAGIRHVALPSSTRGRIEDRHGTTGKRACARAVRRA